MMWGGGDGSTDINNGRGDGTPSAGDMPGGPGLGGAAGAAGAAGAFGGRGGSEDEQIYGGRQDPSPDVPRGAEDGLGMRRRDDGQGMEGYTEDEGWVGDADEEVMQDPWGQQGGGDDSGWFGGGGGGGDGGGWGDWGS